MSRARTPRGPVVDRPLRDDVARAALTVFREKGYERATVREIADRAGIGVSTLYFHIESKEQLLFGLVRPVLEVGAEWLEQIVASDAPATAKLRAACVRSVALYDEHPEIFVYLRDYYPAVERAFPDLDERVRRCWLEIVAAVMGAGVPADPREVRLVTNGILGMFSWMHRWYRPGGGSTATEIGKLYADMVLRGLEPRDP